MSAIAPQSTANANGVTTNSLVTTSPTARLYCSTFGLNASASLRIFRMMANGDWIPSSETIYCQPGEAKSVDVSVVDVGERLMVVSSGTPPTGLVCDLKNISGTTSLGEILTASKTLTAAQVQTLHATPVSVIPAPGAGKWIDIVSAHWYLVYGSAAYDAVGTTDYPELRATNASGALLTADRNPVGFGDATADAHVLIGPATSSLITENAAVVAYLATGEWYGAAGDSALHLEILYRIRLLAI